MYNYGYFPTYTTMLPLYQTMIGSYGLGGIGTQKSTSSRNKWYDMQDRFSSQQSSSDNEKANKGTTLGKEFTSNRDGGGRDGFSNDSIGSTSSKGNDAGPSNKGHSFTDQQAMDDAISGLSTIGIDAATKTGMALALDAPVNVAMNFGLSGLPSGLANTVGQVAAKSFGMTTGTVPGAVVGSMLGSLAGPIGGLLGGLIGPTIGGLLADALNMRDEEVTRDALEDAIGPITGRQIGAAYANNIATHNMDMATINDMTLAEALNDAISGSKSLSPSQVANATAAVNNSIGLANPTSSWGRDLVGPVAATYAGAMASLGDLGADTGSANDEASPVGGFAETGQFGGLGKDQGGYGTDVGGPIGGGAMSHGKAQDNFGGIGLSGVGGVTGETAADTAASTSAAESDTAGGTATGGTDTGTDSGTTGEDGANEGNDAGNDSGDNGSTGNDGDSGGSGGDGNGGGFGNDGGGGSGGSDSQGTGEGQAGDGTGSGANGQNDGGDDGGW
jgi:hypothetical protein